jgi:hypothetical protein
MRFIRSFWGDLDNFNQRHKNEIIHVSKKSKLNEVVFVWGLVNYEFIKSLGFECILMSKMATEYGEDYLYDSDKYMLHKLVSIKLGIELFDKVIFLDWDCHQLKPIDNTFYDLINERDGNIQMPLYTYPKNYSQIVLNEWKDIPSKEKEYVLKQQHYLEKYNYSWENSFVTPNAGFIYCSDSNVIDELILINETQKIGIASEEMSFVEYTKMFCTNLEDYIKRFEPLVCNGKFETHFNQKDLNKFITQIIKKDLYFIHE